MSGVPHAPLSRLCPPSVGKQPIAAAWVSRAGQLGFCASHLALHPSYTRTRRILLRASPDDPDDENTLATAVFEIRDDVTLRVYDRKNKAEITLSDPDEA